MKAITTNSFYAWILAARPKTLTGAVIPVLIGSSLAFADGKFDIIPALLCVLFACGMQIAANFINDLYDYLKGSDRADRLGPERACAQGWITPIAMKRGIAGTLIFSCLMGCCPAATMLGTLTPRRLGTDTVRAALRNILHSYITSILSYQGWGDLLVLVFFGFIPVGGTYYVQAHIITADVWVASLICGLVIDTLLVVNNYRDREQDALSGKRTLIVRFGEPFGRYLYLGLGIAAALLSLWFVYNDKIEPLAFIWAPCVYLYLHVLTWRKMAAIRSGKKLNSILGETSRNMLFFGLLLSLAFIQ